jgi:uncharacterized iron-regulated membrane protein
MDPTPAGAPRAGLARRILRLWHTGFGLTAALWIILLALTGSAIAFYDDLDRWMNLDLRTVPATKLHAVEVDAAIDAVRRDLPGFQARFVDLPNEPRDALMLLGSATTDDSSHGSVQAFADPRDGRLLGWRHSDHFSLHPRQLMNSLYVLHTEMLLGETGVWLIGLVALLWMLDHVAGVALALPRAAAWAAAFRIGGRRWNLRRLYDLHRAPALWLLPMTFMLALTGFCLSWHGESRAVVRLALPVSDRLHEKFPEAQPAIAARVGIDDAIARAASQIDGPIDSVMILPRKAAYGVRSRDARDIDDLGRLWTYVSMDDGRILGQRHDNGAGPGDAFFAWQYPLHSGRALGTPGQAVVSIAGLATAVLCITGVWLWWWRRRDRKPDRRGMRPDGRRNISIGN